MGSETTTRMPTSTVPGWALPLLLELTLEGERLLVVGPGHAVADGLRAEGRVIRDGGEIRPGTDAPSPDLIGFAEDVDTVLLPGTLSWVRDEVRFLRGVVTALPERVRLLVVVPNVSWLPYRLALLAGRSPFGSGAVAERPTRFFARDTLLDAFAAAGRSVVDLRAVTREAVGSADGVPGDLVTELRGLADADVIGFVAVVDPVPRQPEVGHVVDAGRIRSVAQASIGEQVRADVRTQERRSAEQALEVASEVAALRARVHELEAERDRLAPAAAELEVVRGRLGYRALLRLERAASRVPFGVAVWRRISGALRRIVRG